MNIQKNYSTNNILDLITFIKIFSFFIVVIFYELTIFFDFFLQLYIILSSTFILPIYIQTISIKKLIELIIKKEEQINIERVRCNKSLFKVNKIKLTSFYYYEILLSVLMAEYRFSLNNPTIIYEKHKYYFSFLFI